MEYALLALVLAVGLLVVWNRRTADAQADRLMREIKRSAGDAPAILERLEVLERRLHQLDPEPVRAELVRLRAAVEQLTEEPPQPEPARRDEQLPRPAEVRRIVERTLAARGFEQIRILDDDDQLDGEEVVARVEAWRAGLSVKGRVRVLGAELRETELEDSRRLYP